MSATTHPLLTGYLYTLFCYTVSGYKLVRIHLKNSRWRICLAAGCYQRRPRTVGGDNRMPGCAPRDNGNCVFHSITHD